MLQYFIRPECGVDDVWGPVFGPFDDFIQLTYAEIRVGPDGEGIGNRGEDGFYYFYATYRPHNKEEPIPRDMSKVHNCGEDYTKIGFSDVVIWAKEVPENEHDQTHGSGGASSRCVA